MYWFFTGVLIAFSAGVLGFGGYLLRRLFTSEPAADEAVEVPAGLAS